MVRGLHFFLFTSLLVAGSRPALAQIPPATPAQAEAGARVVSAVFEPAQLNLTRDDTVMVRVTLLDAAGQPVEGALAFVFAQGGLGPQADTLGQAGARLIGQTPGSGSATLLIRVADDQGGFQGLSGIKQVGIVEATIGDWPVDRIEVDEPGYVPFVGTTFKLSARAMTNRDTEHTTAPVRWTSRDPSIATITASGILSPSRAGQVTIVASTEGVSAEMSFDVLENPVQQLDISPKSASARTGDVVQFDVSALDGRGRPVEGIALSYSVFGLDSAGAQVFEDGTFVAENPGAFNVLVTVGTMATSAVVDAEARPAPTTVEVLGKGPVAEVATSDLWVFEGQDGRDYAYTGTHAQGGGERMFVWDVTDPSDIQLMDSVVVDARVVNDVKVSADASWAIITREGASNRRNGIVVLDLADPAHPVIVSELTDDLTAGIHNVWINGDIVYAINDGTSALNILDLSDPANPQHAGRWELRPGETDKSLHDVWSDGQYAYVSYWNDGLVILDIGAGTHGGTPTEPTFVSSIAYDMGNTHVAWREGKYVFVGDEIFGCADCTNGPRGYIHVMDVSDIDNPVEVAKYEVPEAGTHNIWVENGVLYIAYYQGGLRIVDVSGELRGDLYRQGREIGWIQTSGNEGEAITPNSPMAWGPQPFKGNIFVSDMNSGLWVLRHARPERLTP